MNRSAPIARFPTLFIALGAACVAMLTVGATSSARAADEFVAQVVSVSGKVLHRNEANKAVKMGFLKPGEKLFEGSVVNTGADGTLKLLMTDRTIVDLGPGSLFKLNEYALNHGGDRRVEIALDGGKMRTSVNQKVTDEKGKFTVRTKAATMGVRGTEFIVTAPAPGAGVNSPSSLGSIAVLSGVVATSVNGPNATNAGGAAGTGTSVGVGTNAVAVTAGHSLALSTSAGSTSNVEPPKALNSQQMTTIKTEASVPDRTFAQTVTFDSKSAPSNQPAPAKNSGGGETGSTDKGADAKNGKSDKGDKGSEKAESGSNSNSGSGTKSGAPGTATASTGAAESAGSAMMNQVSSAVAANITVATGAPTVIAPPPPIIIRVQPPQVPVDLQPTAVKNGGDVKIRVNFIPAK